MTMQAEVHDGTLTKGQYPSNEKLCEEIHSPVKVYESVSEAQRIALQAKLGNEHEKPPNVKDLAALSQKINSEDRLAADSTTVRYTSTRELSTSAQTEKNHRNCKETEEASTWRDNELSLKGAENYAFVPYLSYSKGGADSNVRPNLYNSQYSSSATPTPFSWKPNIAASTSSATDNYSQVELSQV